MLSIILNTIAITTAFSFFDKIITTGFDLEGVYYLIHFINNATVVYLTGEEVVQTITNFSQINSMPKNDIALTFVYALHFYHIIMYYHKLRFDDWLHHILMIGVALPIGTFTDSKSLVGYSLFFTTGLPGGIDYFLLFLVRNGWLRRNTEKKINSYLNVWVRAPGCVSHAVLTFVLVFMNRVTWSLDWWLGLIAGSLTYWNGLYFMRQVVENNIIVQNRFEVD